MGYFVMKNERKRMLAQRNGFDPQIDRATGSQKM